MKFNDFSPHRPQLVASEVNENAYRYMDINVFSSHRSHLAACKINENANCYMQINDFSSHRSELVASKINETCNSELPKATKIVTPICKSMIFSLIDHSS